MNWNEVEICEANISPWQLTSLIFDSIWPLKNKLYTNETFFHNPFIVFDLL